MPAFQSSVATRGETFAENRRYLLSLIDELRGLEARTEAASARSAPRFARRGQLLPRERLGLLLDAGAPFLTLSSLAGYLLDVNDPARSVPGGGCIAGVGSISGTTCMIVVDDSGIEAGALQHMGLEKFQRAQQIALENRLPFVHLVESAGANLQRYRVEDFINGGSHYARLARHSAAGLPVLTLVHGSSTAGGAYMPGMSDYVVMVRDRARAFLAGPPLLRAATGEIATEEELGGAVMHAGVSGLAEYLADDDSDGIRVLRELVTRLGWQRFEAPLPAGREPLYPADELLGIMPKDGRKPVDMREVIARLVDGSDLRRGRDTANQVFGSEASVLVGDYLYSRAFQMMVDLGDMRIQGVMADATNTIAMGEVLQLMNAHDPDTSEESYLEVIYRKTAKLFEAGAQMAAILAGAPPAVEEAMVLYGRHLGTAFQLVDDALDYRADREELGKNLGDDLAEGKPTLPLIYAMAHSSIEDTARMRVAVEHGGLDELEAITRAIESAGGLEYTARLAQREKDLAIEALGRLPESAHRQALQALAEFAVGRSY